MGLELGVALVLERLRVLCGVARGVVLALEVRLGVCEVRGNLGEVAAPPARRAVVQRTPHLDAAEEPPRERLRLQRRHLALAREPGVARRAPRSARGFAVHRSLRQHLGVGAPRDPIGEAALAEDVRAVRVHCVAVLHEVAAYLARELAHDALVGEHVRDWETHRPTPRSSARERGAPRVNSFHCLRKTRNSVMVATESESRFGADTPKRRQRRNSSIVEPRKKKKSRLVDGARPHTVEALCVPSGRRSALAA